MQGSKWDDFWNWKLTIWSTKTGLFERKFNILWVDSLHFYLKCRPLISDTPSMIEFTKDQNPNEKPIIWTDYNRINSTHFKSNSLDVAMGIFPDLPVVLSDLRKRWPYIFSLKFLDFRQMKNIGSLKKSKIKKLWNNDSSWLCLQSI